MISFSVPGALTLNLRLSLGVKMRKGLQKAESTLATHIRTKRIGLEAYLHSRKEPEVESPECSCGRARQTANHVLLFCPDHEELRKRMLHKAGSQDDRQIIFLVKGLKAAARMITETGLPA